jgi:ectoine hydroxylase-related dioxygenase (phytanoyl-CoA dioxygenase family)
MGLEQRLNRAQQQGAFIKAINQLDSSESIKVPTVVGPEAVQSFIDDGYLVVSDLVTREEVEEMRADLLKLARGGYPCESLTPLPADVDDEEALFRILCIHQPHYLSPVMKKYVEHPKICGVLSQIAAAHLPHWDGSVKCMQSMAFVKPPGFQGQAWHQDEGYISTRDRSLLGAWIALDDATIENGCLYVIPGSHRNGMLWPQKPHENDDEFDFAGESYGFDESGEIPVEVKAGNLVFFNGYLLHRSRKNQSDLPRRVLVSHYCNAWSLLPWTIREGESPANADRRGIVPVSGVDPYLWKGYDEPADNVWLRTCKANLEE